MGSIYNVSTGATIADADATLDPVAGFVNEYVALASTITMARTITFDAASANDRHVVRVIVESQAPGGDIIVKNTLGTTLYTFSAGFGGTRAISLYASANVYYLLSYYYADTISALPQSAVTNLTTDLAARFVSAGKAGGQSAVGGTADSENLTLSSTAHGTKGHIRFGGATNYWDEVNSKFVLGNATAFTLNRAGDQTIEKTGASGDLYLIASGKNMYFVTSGYALTLAADATVSMVALGTAGGGYVKAANGSGELSVDATIGYKPLEGTALTNADQTLQPGTDKVSQYVQVTALSTNRTKTLGTTSVVTGTVVRIVREESSANTIAIVNGGGSAGTLFTFGASPTEFQAASFFYNGADWVFIGFEYLQVI